MTQAIIIYFIYFIVCILITRAIFSIGTIVKNMKAQTTLLYLIARQQKVPEDAIQKVVKESGVKYIYREVNND